MGLASNSSCWTSYCCDYPGRSIFSSVYLTCHDFVHRPGISILARILSGVFFYTLLKRLSQIFSTYLFGIFLVFISQLAGLLRCCQLEISLLSTQRSYLLNNWSPLKNKSSLMKDKNQQMHCKDKDLKKVAGSEWLKIEFWGAL